jgi:hypothetical protein
MYPHFIAKVFLPIICALTFLFIPDFSVAGKLLFPLTTGQKMISIRSDNTGNSWSVTGEVAEEVTLGSKSYFRLVIRNYNNEAEYDEIYFRSTEKEVYFYEGTKEFLAFQVAPVGTKWVTGDTVREITAIEAVTVPYGGPYQAYVHRNHKPSKNSPYWYTYIVPGVGMVKEVDFYTSNAPAISELVNVLKSGWVNIKGTVTYNGSPVCTMVLANGQHMFTCSGDGSFSLNVPLDKEGKITLFSFCSGLSPFRTTIYPEDGEDMAIALQKAEPGQGMNISYDFDSVSSTRAQISGTVTYKGAPVCSMVLANGQHMFTCSGDGSFSLNVPLNSKGAITFFAFCSGLPPFRYDFNAEEIY